MKYYTCLLILVPVLFSCENVIEDLSNEEQGADQAVNMSGADGSQGDMNLGDPPDSDLRSDQMTTDLFKQWVTLSFFEETQLAKVYAA